MPSCGLISKLKESNNNKIKPSVAGASNQTPLIGYSQVGQIHINVAVSMQICVEVASPGRSPEDHKYRHVYDFGHHVPWLRRWCYAWFCCRWLLHVLAVAFLSQFSVLLAFSGVADTDQTMEGLFCSSDTEGNFLCCDTMFWWGPTKNVGRGSEAGKCFGKLNSFMLEVGSSKVYTKTLVNNKLESAKCKGKELCAIFKRQTGSTNVDTAENGCIDLESTCSPWNNFGTQHFADDPSWGPVMPLDIAEGDIFSGFVFSQSPTLH